MWICRGSRSQQQAVTESRQAAPNADQWRPVQRSLGWFVVAITVLGAASCGTRNSAPIKLAEKRIVAADIEDYPNFVRQLRMPAGAAGLPGVASMAGTPGGADPSHIVAIRDDPEGKYLFLRILINQRYQDAHDSAAGVFDYFTPEDFALRGEKSLSLPVLLFPGSLEKTPAAERANLRGVKIERVAHGDKAEYKVEPDGLGTLPDDKKYMRPTLAERLQKINPPALAKNVWLAMIDSHQETGWNNAEVTVLFPIPEGENKLSLVIHQDNEHAVPIKIRRGGGENK